MTKIYQGTVGVVVILDTSIDLTSASERKILVRKPSGAEVEWAATLSGSTALQHAIAADDIADAGEYFLQAKVTIGSLITRGETAKLIVSENFF